MPWADVVAGGELVVKEWYAGGCGVSEELIKKNRATGSVPGS